MAMTNGLLGLGGLQPLMKQLHIQSPKIPPEILDELISRFVMNIPEEERLDATRVCFQVELAHWFFVDNYCGEDKSDFWKELGHIKFLDFAALVFQRTPYLQREVRNVERIVQNFKEYKMKVPTFGAILMNEELTHVVLVQGFGGQWGFPKGKINKDEDPADCAAREVEEETGYECSALLNRNHFIESCSNERWTRLYIIRGVDRNFILKPHTRYEIKNIGWFQIAELPECKKDPSVVARPGFPHTAFHNIFPYIKRLRRWIDDKLQRKNEIEYFKSHAPNRPDHILDRNWKPAPRNRKGSECSSNQYNSAHNNASGPVANVVTSNPSDLLSAFIFAQSQKVPTTSTALSNTAPITPTTSNNTNPKTNNPSVSEQHTLNGTNKQQPSMIDHSDHKHNQFSNSCTTNGNDSNNHNHHFHKNINPKRRLFASDDDDEQDLSKSILKLTKLKALDNATESKKNHGDSPSRILSSISSNNERPTLPDKVVPADIILPSPTSWINFKLNSEEIIKAMSLTPPPSSTTFVVPVASSTFSNSSSSNNSTSYNNNKNATQKRHAQQQQQQQQQQPQKQQQQPHNIQQQQQQQNARRNNKRTPKKK